MLLRLRLPSWLTLPSVGGIESLSETAAQFQVSAHNEDEADTPDSLLLRASDSPHDRMETTEPNATFDKSNEDVLDVVGGSFTEKYSPNKEKEYISDKPGNLVSVPNETSGFNPAGPAANDEGKRTNPVIIKSTSEVVSRKDLSKFNTEIKGVQEQRDTGAVKVDLVMSSEKETTDWRDVEEERAAYTLMMGLPCPASCIHFRPADRTTYLLGTLAGHVLLVR